MVAIKSLSIFLTYAISVCGVIPLLPWLTTVPLVFLALGFASGIIQDFRGRWVLKPWMQNITIVPFFIYYYVQFSRSNPLDPVVTVLAIMLAVRLCGEKTIRHTLQIHALSLFCLASSSLFDLSPLFLVYLGILMFLVAVALVLMTFLNQDAGMCLSKADLRKVLSAGLLMPLLSLPLMLFFFPVLPRTQLPLWNFLSSTVGMTSGLSDKVEPGSKASVGESHVLAFRAEMEKQAQQQLYWRGTVFNQLDGNRWVRDRAVPAEVSVFSKQTIPQAIYPEPTDSKALIALDRPASLSLKWMKRSPDGVYEYFGSARKRQNYFAESVTASLAVSGRPIDRSFYLRLPADIPTRIKQLATDIRRTGNSDLARLELLEAYFRNGGYRYSTRDLPIGVHATERFLFETKQGHCEFFASAFAILLRSAGVPCRLVGGYLGGDYNDLGGYYLVSEQMAHVWVEVFIDGSGWLRVDPSAFAENAGTVFNQDTSRGPMNRLRLAFDSIDHVWNRTVVPYDFEQQVDFVRYAGRSLQALDSVKTIRTLVVVAAVMVLGSGLIMAVRRKLLFCSREERVLRWYVSSARRDFGIDTSLGQKGMLEIAEESGSEKMLEFARIYSGAIYRDRKLTDAEYRQLQMILKEGFGSKTSRLI